MQVFKPNEGDLPELKRAAQLLKTANELLATAKKSADAAKATLQDWLKKERKCEVATLPIGEMVQIEGVLLVEVAKQNRFDEKGFMLAHADLHTAFKRDVAVVKMKPLV